MIKPRIIVHSLLSFTLAIALTCEIDHGIEPLPGTLGVEVIFIKSRIPKDTQGIYLFVAPTFPPHAINELFLSPNTLPFWEIDTTGSEYARDTLYTEISLPYGHYDAIGLWWYNKGTESNLADVFTLKLDQNYLPAEITLSPDSSYVRTELWANLTRVEREASIEGTISFNGPFPSNTLVTAVGAYLRTPVEKVEYLIYLVSMDFSINENPYHFTLPVPNRYPVLEYLGVFWLSDRSGLDNFQTIGYYEDPNNPGQPGTVTIKKNGSVAGFDINADWSLIEP